MDGPDGLGTAAHGISLRQGALRPSKVCGWLRFQSAVRTPLRPRAVEACLAGAMQQRLVCQTALPRTCKDLFACCLLANTRSLRVSEALRVRERVRAGGGALALARV